MLEIRPQQTTKNSFRRIQIALIFALFPVATSESPILHQTCNSNAQCLHGGTCRYTETGQGTFLQCVCADGYTGSRCEHFCPLACQHGGICRSTQDSNDKSKPKFTCRCMGYFTGRLCETPYENCNEGFRCYNHGTCRETKNDHGMILRFCQCPSGWTGPSCDVRASLAPDDIIVSSSGRTALWVVSVLLVLLAMGGMILYRRKWRSRRWRYHAFTRRAVAKFQNRTWFPRKNHHHRHREFHDDEDLSDSYLDDASNHPINLHSIHSPGQFRDTPDYKNVI